MTPAAVPVLVYDGDCGFCSSVARWVSAAWKAPARAEAWQRLGVDGLARLGLTEQEADRTAWWVDAEGRRFAGHLAVAHALAGARGWKGLAGRLLLVPPFRWLGAVAYPLVARNRHRLPGGTPTCRT